MKSRELVKTIKNHTLFTIILLGALIAALIIGAEYVGYRLEIQDIRVNYMVEQKALIRDRVLDFIEYAEIERETQRKHTEVDLASRVKSAWQTANNLYKQYNHNHSEAELKDIIKASLTSNRFDSNESYYFIIDSKGNSIINAYDPSLEGQNFWLYQDAKGNYFVQDEISAALLEGEGYVTGHWENPLNEDKPFERLIYVKYFEPYDWIIGTGFNMINAEIVAQNEVLQRMQSTRFGKQGYIFANTYDGTALVLDGKVLEEKKNIWDLEDPNGFKVIQAERQAAQNPEGDYIYYMWNKLQEREPVKKMSYIKGIEAWEWMVGSGIYLDEIEEIISQRQDDLYDRVLMTIFNVLIISVIALVVIYTHTVRLTDKLERNMAMFVEFFRKASESKEQMDLDEIVYKEFKALGAHANEMIRAKSEVQDELESMNQNLEELVEERTLALQKQIEDSKTLQEKLIQKEKMAIVGELVPGFAHDINTPVGVAVTANSFVKRKISKVKDQIESGNLKKSAIEMCLSELEESTDIIEKNLQASAEQVRRLKRLSIDQSIDEFRRFDLVEYLNEIVLSLKPITKQGRHNVEISAPETLVIRSYPGLYFQIFSNLITNSIVHGFMGREQGLITIEIKKMDNRLSIIYKDNGSGIQEDHIERVFNPYFTTKKHAGGSGIGLSVVHNLVTTVLEGQITCSSELSHGTVFEMHIKADLEDAPN